MISTRPPLVLLAVADAIDIAFGMKSFVQNAGKKNEKSSVFYQCLSQLCVCMSPIWVSIRIYGSWSSTHHIKSHFPFWLATCTTLNSYRIRIPLFLMLHTERNAERKRIYIWGEREGERKREWDTEKWQAHRMCTQIRSKSVCQNENTHPDGVWMRFSRIAARLVTVCCFMS